mmetsp:Transcript_85056/g.134717  ORF Transcript_85056/g.134717 Transcript_85056/m.134717 type:complete len:214 (-) Transcript_85056:314-955(-)
MVQRHRRLGANGGPPPARWDHQGLPFAKERNKGLAFGEEWMSFLAWEEDVHLTDVCGISKAAVGARFVVATHEFVDVFRLLRWKEKNHSLTFHLQKPLVRLMVASVEPTHRSYDTEMQAIKLRQLMNRILLKDGAIDLAPAQREILHSRWRPGSPVIFEESTTRADEGTEVSNLQSWKGQGLIFHASRVLEFDHQHVVQVLHKSGFDAQSVKA